MKPIVVVGSINMDLVVQCSRMPAPGETVQGTGFAMHHGGKGANQAVAASRLGAATALIGCVGQDSFGHDLLMGLQASHVDTAGVRIVGDSSGTALIQVDAQGENRITVVAGANAYLTTEVLAAQRLRIDRAGMVLTQLETPLETVAALAAVCTTQNVPFMLDPAPARALAPDLLASVTWLTPNLSEAHTLLGLKPRSAVTEDSAKSLAHALLETGCAGVLLKLGGVGAVAVQRGGAALFCPAFPVNVVDTTAAGDATNAAFATALLRWDGLESALRQATAAGALTTCKGGAQPSLPTYDEVQRFLRANRA